MRDDSANKNQKKRFEPVEAAAIAYIAARRVKEKRLTLSEHAREE